MSKMSYTEMERGREITLNRFLYVTAEKNQIRTNVCKHKTSFLQARLQAHNFETNRVRKSRLLSVFQAIKILSLNLYKSYKMKRSRLFGNVCPHPHVIRPLSLSLFHISLLNYIVSQRPLVNGQRRRRRRRR